jgi:hypothetical protein
MSAPKTYFVKGSFEGHFKTNQRSFLKSDEPFPKGNEHLVQIYRGIVSQSEEIEQHEFETLDGFYNFREIQNVQVNTSNHWPVPNDRIFSLTNAKLVNVKVSNVQQVGDQTLGEIRADLISEVVDGQFHHQGNNQNNDNGTNDGGNTQNNDGGNGDGSGNSNGGNDNDQGGNGSGGGDPTTPRKGCLRWFPNLNWLRWLLYLLLILLLLYILGRCTQFTQKIYCKIADNRVVEKLKLIKHQNDTLQQKITNTTFKIEPCGGGMDFEGSNVPWSRMVDIGEQSGRVQINFAAKTIPDRLEVIYDGKIVAESKQDHFEQDSDGETFWYLRNYGGFTQGDTTFYFDYKYDVNKPTQILIRVIPNKMYSGTLWNVTYGCPQ